MKTFANKRELEAWYQRSMRALDTNSSLTLWEQKCQEDIITFIFKCNESLLIP
jgi:hypothetical protein